MIIVRLLSPGPWLVGTTKVYPGVGADIVMESIILIAPQPGVLSENAWLQQLALHSKRRGRTFYGYCSFAYSALACFRMGMSGSASFQSARKSL
jgi:hypothetical protein